MLCGISMLTAGNGCVYEKQADFEDPCLLVGGEVEGGVAVRERDDRRGGLWRSA